MKIVDPSRVETIIREVTTEKIMPRFCHLDSEQVTRKRDRSLVTIADQEAEQQLAVRLSELLPGSRVVGEEVFAANPEIFEHFESDAPVWVIDPIDGTSNYVSGNQRFGVMVALVQSDKVVAGWIYHPCSDEFVTAEVGSGAYYKGKRLQVLDGVSLENMRGMFYGDAVLAVGNKHLAGTPIFAEPHYACSHEYPNLVLGGEHFGKTASQLHFYGMGPFATPWDIAAGALIHGEAGGYSAFWDTSAFALTAFPAMYKTPFLSAPSQEAWMQIKNWIEAKTDFLKSANG
jgi:fructose-1,6-bisphosphatase/inositol monophosphatase family enzyme